MVIALIQTDVHAKQIATRASEFANECHPKSSNMLTETSRASFPYSLHKSRKYYFSLVNRILAAAHD